MYHVTRLNDSGHEILKFFLIYVRYNDLVLPFVLLSLTKLHICLLDLTSVNLPLRRKCYALLHQRRSPTHYYGLFAARSQRIM